MKHHEKDFIKSIAEKPENERIGSETYYGVLADSAIKKMSKISGLTDRFYHLTVNDQITILLRLKGEGNVWDAVAYIELAELLNNDSERIKEARERPILVLDELDNPETFTALYADYLHHQDAQGTLHQVAIPLMVELYPIETIISALKYWRKNENKSSFYDFLKLVQRWDELKDFPIDWTIQVIGVHK